MIQKDLDNCQIDKRHHIINVPNIANGNTFYPYYAVGSSGIISVASDLHTISNKKYSLTPEYWSLLANSLLIKNSIYYGKNFGAAGILKALRKFPSDTISPDSYNNLLNIRKIMLKLIYSHIVTHNNLFLGFPTDQLTKVSYDTGSGTLGIIKELLLDRNKFHNNKLETKT